MRNKTIEVSNLRFLSIHLEVNLKTGKVEKIVNYDPRVIERKKEKLLHKYINKFIKKMLKHTLNEKKDK